MARAASWFALLPFVAAPSVGAVEATPATPFEALPKDCVQTPLGIVPGADEFFAAIALGTYPVWMTGGGPQIAPGDTDTFGALAGTTVGMADSGDPRYGWFNKRLWVIAGEATAPATVRGHRLGDGLPMWFDFYGRLESEVVLDPAHPTIPVQHGDWREFPSNVYYPASGCYEIEVSWAGGGWTATVLFVAPPPELGTPVAAAAKVLQETPLGSDSSSQADQ